MTICGKDPIFIGCMPRSGSSLLRVMLDSHPSMAADREVGWFASDNPAKLLKASYARMGKRFVNKEPKSLSFQGLVALRKLFGQDLYFIHIKRKPEDVYISYSKTGVSDEEFVKDAWHYISGLTAKDQWPEKHIVTSYEDLVANPRGELKRLCFFLGIAFNEQMLEFHKKQHRTHDHHSDHKATKPIFTDSVGQAKSKTLPKAIQALCNQMAKLQGD